MPFGMKNSPATFQHFVNKVISGPESVRAYIDDVIIYSNTWGEHLRLIQSYFHRLPQTFRISLDRKS